MAKRFASLVIVLVVLLGALAACTSGGNEQGQSSKPESTAKTQTDAGSKEAQTPVTIRYAIWQQEEEPAYKKIVQMFMEKHPNIKVEMSLVPWDAYWQKLQTEIAGGAAPDVFWNFIPRVPELASKNALLNLTQYIQRDNVDLSKYNASLVKAFNYKDKAYGIPKDWDSLGFFYNKALLKKAGIDQYPTDLSWNPKDGGSLVAFLKKLTLDKNGKHPDDTGFDPKQIVQYGFSYMINEVDAVELQSYIASNGGHIIQDGKLALDDPKVPESIQFLYDLTYKYHVAPPYTDIKTTGAESLFYSQKIAVWMSGPWMLNSVTGKAPFEVGIAHFPDGPSGRIVRVNGLADSIYANTKHPEEAWQLVKFIASKEAQDVLGQTGTVFPAYLDSIPTYVDFYKKSKNLDSSVFVDQYKGQIVTDPQTMNYNQWNEIWIKYMGLILSGEMDVKTGLEKIQSEGNVVIGK